VEHQLAKIAFELGLHLKELKAKHLRVDRDLMRTPS